MQGRLRPGLGRKDGLGAGKNLQPACLSFTPELRPRLRWRPQNPQGQVSASLTHEPTARCYGGCAHCGTYYRHVRR